MKTKRIEMVGDAGNDRTVEIVITGASDTPVAGNQELAREAARVLYNTLPGYAWDVFVETINRLDMEDPYLGL